MSGKSIKMEYLFRFIIVAAVVMDVVVNDNHYLEQYIVYMLLFLLSSQIRIVFLKDKWFLLSIFVDMGLIYYIHLQYSDFTYLLLYIPIFDSISFLLEEAYLTGFIGLGLLVYLLKERSSEIIILNVILYIIVFVFAYQLKRLRDKMNEVEVLYDQNRKYSYQLEDAKKRLEDYSKKIEHASQLEERNRISRELHDTLGHKLTGVLMQLEATIRILEIDIGKGKQMLGAVRDNMNQCVDILRQTVSNMRPKQYGNRMLSIRQMINDFARDTGVNIHFLITGDPFKLYPSVELTLYKNTQEAITNAVRHGRATKIDVILAYTDNEVILTVKDNGTGVKNIVKGMGISGMEERVSLLGGRLHIHSNNGFEITTIIPVPKKGGMYHAN